MTFGKGNLRMKTKGSGARRPAGRRLFYPNTFTGKAGAPKRGVPDHSTFIPPLILHHSTCTRVIVKPSPEQIRIFGGCLLRRGHSFSASRVPPPPTGLEAENNGKNGKNTIKI